MCWEDPYRFDSFDLLVPLCLRNLQMGNPVRTQVSLQVGTQMHTTSCACVSGYRYLLTTFGTEDLKV